MTTTRTNRRVTFDPKRGYAFRVVNGRIESDITYFPALRVPNPPRGIRILYSATGTAVCPPPAITMTPDGNLLWIERDGSVVVAMWVEN